MGTEIRQFTSIKDIVDFISNQILQNKSLFEDYSQWLGTLLRDFESDHKNDEWYQKTAAIQKNLKSQSKQPQEKSSSNKKGKTKGGKGEADSCWVNSGELQISFVDEAQTQILFEAIEKIKAKIQEFEKFKLAIQQLSRLGLGTTVAYLIYIEDDNPKKIVLKSRGNVKGDESFNFAAEFSVPAFCDQ
jgi:anti-sigma28 factor (negative regulator of flagellin synthesis)